MVFEKEISDLRCQELVSPKNGDRWSGKVICGKPAKGFLENGNPACGMHLKAERTWKEKVRKMDENSNRNKELCILLKDKYDVSFVSLDVSRNTITLNIDNFLKILEKR